MRTYLTNALTWTRPRLPQHRCRPRGGGGGRYVGSCL